MRVNIRFTNVAVIDIGSVPEKIAYDLHVFTWTDFVVLTTTYTSNVRRHGTFLLLYGRK